VQSILPILAAYPGAVCTYNTAEVSQQSFGSKLIYNLSLNKNILLLFYMHSLYFVHVCLHALINVRIYTGTCPGSRCLRVGLTS